MTQERTIGETALSPGGAAALGEALQDPNVVGYGIGPRRTAAEWIPERCLCFYVREKFSEAQITEGTRATRALPRRIDGLRTDVLAIGEFRANDISHLSEFRSLHATFGAAALATPQGGPHLALVAGHAALPRGPGGSWTPIWQGGGQVQVQAFYGDIVGGRFGGGGSVDWAVARLHVPAHKITLQNHVTGAPPPQPHTGVFQPHQPVHFHSPARHVSITGEVLHFTGDLQVWVGGSPTHAAYSNLLIIRSTTPGQNFSVDSDSGSLVFDQENRAIGMIVGSSDAEPISAIATISALLGDSNFAPFRPIFFA